MVITKDKYLSDVELNDTVRILERYPSRDTTIIRLAIATGARASELLKITKNDLDENAKAVYIRAVKGSLDRWIPLTDDLFAAVKEYLPFDIKYDRLDDIWRFYRPVEKSFHSLRHTFAINLYRRTKDVKLVQMALGHKSMTSTQIYMNFVYSMEEMRRALVTA